MNAIQKYYIRSLNYSKHRFIVELVAMSIILKLFLGVVWGLLATIIDVPSLSKQSVSYQNDNIAILIIVLGILAPLIETFTQWIPIKILKKVTTNYLIIIFITALLFASLHLSYSPFYATMVFPVGIVLSWSFYCKYKKSLREAFLTTFLIHAFHNLFTISFIIL
ncbi:CPBP family intramembrane glutamic endopeptidase [Fodinibius halophilus]|uniref:CPBP family intramembrane metalloprotease n=1 Tax=Fodinibius halophilus TaxID=1736908 RepID=A0A6M1TN25_9BACT|nr:CPBP family intramembrane metalloprotease [Fodinibius halophilus]